MLTKSVISVNNCFILGTIINKNIFQRFMLNIYLENMFCLKTELRARQI